MLNLKLLKYRLKTGVLHILMKLPLLKGTMRFGDTNNAFSFSIFFMQKIVGFNRRAYWPVHFTSIVSNPANILCGLDGAPGLSPGCYIQGKGKVVFGDFVIMGPNVGVISGNHVAEDLRESVVGDISIGSYSWIGMNSVILPGVVLGPHTVVAAGSIVTKPFPEGYCILGGNPAKIIKRLEPAKCVEYEFERKYYGYIPADKFERYRKRHLNV